jgi:hypothetical protein
MQWVIGAGGYAADLSRDGGWVEAMAPILLERQRRMELGQLARERCVQYFSRDRVVDQILQYYDFVLHHDQGSPDGRPAAS